MILNIWGTANREFSYKRTKSKTMSFDFCLRRTGHGFEEFAVGRVPVMARLYFDNAGVCGWPRGTDSISCRCTPQKFEKNSTWCKADLSDSLHYFTHPPA